MSFYLKKKQGFVFQTLATSKRHLQRHHKHCCTLLYLLNPRWYQNEIWLDINVIYIKHFQFAEKNIYYI